MTDEDIKLRGRCTEFISYHGARDPQALLRRLADHPLAEVEPDFYGRGGALAKLEQYSAQLLDKPCARFYLRGQVAQLNLVQMLVANRPVSVAVAARSHMAVDEAEAVTQVTGAPLVRLGGDGPFSVAELEALQPRPFLCVVELPLRRAAYRLPPIEELRAISRWCRAEGVYFHIDGARLWEAAAGYGVPLSELTALADSVYVSFYKGLGGLAGAVLAGETALLEALEPWRTRMGGDIHCAFPYVLAALDGLANRLPRMGSYVARARALAVTLREAGFSPFPASPHCNAFQISLPRSPEWLAARNRRIAREHGLWMFDAFEAGPEPESAVAEIVVGEATRALADEQLLTWLGKLLAEDHLT